MKAVVESDGLGQSLWLELRVEGELHRFELASDERRAVAVGSLPRTDLRIERPGVAPVQFHIERESNALWIVPAYGARELRVDTARLTGPKRIDERAVIEFCEVRIEAKVLRSSNLTQVLAQWERSATHHGDAAQLGAQAVLPTVAGGRFETPQARSEGLETRRLELVPHTSPAEPHRTVAIEPLRVIPLEQGSETPPITLRTGEAPTRLQASDNASMGAPENVRPQDTIRMAPFWMVEREPAHELPVAAAAAAKQTEAPVQFIQQAVAALATTVFDYPPVRAGRSGAHDWLARLGFLSRRQPLLVWGAGSATSFVLAAAVVLIIKPEAWSLHEHPTSPHAAAAVTVTSSALAIPGLGPNEPLSVVRAIPPTASGDIKTGQSSNPELVSAVGHLVSGRYRDAQQAYRALAVQFPHDPAIVTLARLLDRISDPKCSVVSTSRKISCPEVRP